MHSAPSFTLRENILLICPGRLIALCPNCLMKQSNLVQQSYFDNSLFPGWLTCLILTRLFPAVFEPLFASPPRYLYSDWPVHFEKRMIGCLTPYFSCFLCLYLPPAEPVNFAPANCPAWTSLHSVLFLLSPAARPACVSVRALLRDFAVFDLLGCLTPVIAALAGRGPRNCALSRFWGRNIHSWHFAYCPYARRLHARYD